MTTIEYETHAGPANEMGGSSEPSGYNDLGLRCRHKASTKVIAASQFNITGKIMQCIGPRPCLVPIYFRRRSYAQCFGSVMSLDKSSLKTL